MPLAAVELLRAVDAITELLLCSERHPTRIFGIALKAGRPVFMVPKDFQDEFAAAILARFPEAEIDRMGVDD